MSQQIIIDYWVEKAIEDLASARDNLKSGRYHAVRDAYFACFHAFSSVLIREGKTFKKHKEVRSMLHRDFIRTKKMDRSWGKHYDWLFDNRHKADYRPLIQFDADQVKEIVEESEAFLKEMAGLLNRSKQNGEEIQKTKSDQEAEFI
ncbi:MAG: HEPN domain-containing protein [Deltaproteobacteria bacterium]|jgi:uncharacterized protein (UPF0332 family)|nr:HEPN domain-containing protein [Deltaproteobacteria bacterium]